MAGVFGDEEEYSAPTVSYGDLLLTQHKLKLQGFPTTDQQLEVLKMLYGDVGPARGEPTALIVASAFPEAAGNGWNGFSSDLNKIQVIDNSIAGKGNIWVKVEKNSSNTQQVLLISIPCSFPWTLEYVMTSSSETLELKAGGSFAGIRLFVGGSGVRNIKERLHSLGLRGLADMYDQLKSDGLVQPFQI